MEDITYAYIILVERPRRRRHLAIPRSEWKITLKWMLWLCGLHSAGPA
jgi:hypothetical protein